MRRNAQTLADTRDSAPLFSALGDETRLWLVARLIDGGPMSIARLTAGSNLTRQAITKHLCVMDEAGLVHSARRGRENLWQLDQRRVQRARRYLDLISKRWDVALARLREHVED
jgi:DNA-binding transcriptional ArsR family regulator